MGKLKVALAFDDSLDRPDGVQQQLKLLGSWLASSGCEVVYLAGETKAKQIESQKVYSLSRNFSVWANQNKLSLPRPVSLEKIEAVFEREQFDAVHITLPFSPFLGRQIVRAALRRNLPLVGTFHTFPASKMQTAGSWLYGRWLSRYLKHFSAITSVSEATRRYAAASFLVETQIIPNFIDISKFSSSKHKKKLFKDKAAIVYLGRLVKRKGAQHLLEAAGILNSQGKFDGRQLVICGRGGLAKRLKTRAIELRLASSVAMPGFIDEASKADYLASADLAVFPATGGEAFGIVLLEAMAAGTLVLGGDNPGYRSVLAERPELLTDSTNHQEFAQKIDALLSDKSLRKKLLKWQGQQVKQYDISEVGPRLLDLYSRKPPKA